MEEECFLRTGGEGRRQGEGCGIEGMGGDEDGGAVRKARRAADCCRSETAKTMFLSDTARSNEETHAVIFGSGSNSR